MRKRNMTLGKAIREFIIANPGATTEAVMEATGCKNKQQIYQARTYLNTQGILKNAVEKVRQVVAGEPIPMDLEAALPASGLRLKLREGRKMIGTLGITHSGVKFTPANGKKAPGRQVAWKLLRALSDIEVG